MRGILCCSLIFVLCAAPAFTGSNARAAEATIENIIITNSDKDLLVYFLVRGSFTEDMRRAILKGVPTTFRYRVELYKKISFYPDKKISSVTINRTIKYDTLRNDFTLEMGVGDGPPVTVKEFFKARELLTEVNALKLAKLDQLEPDRTYYVRIKAELNKVRLPFYLHYVFFFVSLWDFETDWHVVYFTY